MVKRKQSLILIVAAIAAGSASGQTISLFDTFTTPNIDRVSAVAADRSGIYVFGSRAETRRSGLRKYDSTGRALWTRDLDVEVSRAVGDSNGVYAIIPQTPSEASIRKYGADGNQLWNGPLPFFPFALATDSTAVYVAGGDYNTAFVRKYSREGRELWTKRFGEIETAAGLAVDATGVYALVIHSNGAPGVRVRKWDALGGELWTRTISESDLARIGNGILTAAYPAGFYLLASGILRRYDSSGIELWRRHLDLFAGDNMAADETGVYISGPAPVAYSPYRPLTVLRGQCRSGSGGDSFVRKFDLEGVEIWNRQFGTTDGARARGMAVADQGVYVGGVEGTAEARDDWEHFEAFAPAEPVRNAFLLRLEKSAPAPNAEIPRIFPDCVLNAASYVGGGVAPGESVVIFGSGIGPSELVTFQLTGDRVARSLAETRILFDGMPAPLVYVSHRQSSAIVPFAISGRDKVNVQVEYKGVRSEALIVPVHPSRPGIFSLDASGEGQAAILNEDGTWNSPANPARRGSVVTMYVTGAGESASGLEEGQIVGAVAPRVTLPVSVMFDLATNEFQVQSRAAEILYAGGVAGSFAGVVQIDLRVPANAVATGSSVPFLLIIGSRWTVYQVSLSLR